MSGRATRRQLFGAPAAMLLVGRAGAGEGKARELDGRLLGLTAELLAIHARADGLETQDDDAALSDVLDDYWEIADQIEEIPARTPEGIQAKARVLLSVVEMVGQEEGALSDHMGSLLRDILGRAGA